MSSTARSSATATPHAQARRSIRTPDPTRIGRFTPSSPIAVAGAGAAVYAPRLLPAVDGNETATGLLTQLHGYQWPLLAVAAALCALDVSRYRARKWTQMLESVVRQTTGDLPRKVTVSLAPRRRTICRAAITLHPGTVIRPKAFSRADLGNRGGMPWPRQAGGPPRA
ncbi:hypothetical protein QM806_38420 [Rhodococcus sp. IEGM 1351]|uniref:hypothetical protein n=1 Tax=Rhodococcus sp. IEGM 1351 TaxID=3047089 RepID=UPI0024B64382|nr:hypothetical protein [Rhodococcus sp. IEGM 1351]MDI9941227.1 hypothetical protein [Rhodococcus sp. IEGM 1351]